MATAAVGLLPVASTLLPSQTKPSTIIQNQKPHSFSHFFSLRLIPQASQKSLFLPSPLLRRDFLVCCLPSTSGIGPVDPTKLYVSGLSFRTTEESLQNAFQKYGQLVEVNLVMDRIANRPRGFAFLQYSTEEESKKAMEGMHGKFLDGRVIFVEISKRKVRQRANRRPSQF